MAWERHGHQSGCSTVRLPLKPAVRGRRAIYSLLPWNSSEIRCATSRKVQEMKDWKSTRKRRTFSATKDQTEEVTIDNIKVEVLPVKERAKYLGQAITFEQQETAEIKNRIRAAWASFHQVQTGVNIEDISATTQASLVQHGHQSLLHWHVPLEHGPSRMNTQNWSDRHNARCFASSFRRSENIRKKLKKSNEEKKNGKRWGANK